MSKIAMAAVLGLALTVGAAQAQPKPPPPGALRAGTLTMCPASVAVTAPAGWVSIGRGGGQTQFQTPVHQAIITDDGYFLCEYGNQLLRIMQPGRTCTIVNRGAWQGDLNIVSAITCGTIDFNGIAHPDACQVQCQP